VFGEEVGFERTKNCGIKNFGFRIADLGFLLRHERLEIFKELSSLDEIPNPQFEIRNSSRHRISRFMYSSIGICEPESHESYDKEPNQRQQRLTIGTGTRDDDAEQQWTHP